MQECGSRDLSVAEECDLALQGGSRNRARRMRQPQTTKQDGCRLGRAVVARQLGFGDDAAERPSGECSDHQAT